MSALLLYPSKTEAYFERISFYVVESYLNGVPELQKLSRTSKYMRQTFCHNYFVRLILERNMNGLLSSFGINLAVLQTLLRSTTPVSIVSGSFVLQAYIGEQWQTSDLDIYVPLVKTREIVASSSTSPTTTLITITSFSEHPSSPNETIMSTVTIEEPASPPRMVTKINILSTLRTYHSSLENFDILRNESNDKLVNFYQHGYVNFIRSVRELYNINNYKKLQLIFVDIRLQTSVEFIVSTFDLSIVSNLYDGTNWKFGNVQHIVSKTMEFLPQLLKTQKLAGSTFKRILKYKTRGFQFVKTTEPAYICEDFWAYINSRY